MMISRDITQRLLQDKGSAIQILLGPRQCGKSTLFSYISGDTFTEITFDDLQLRQLANHDPALFLTQHQPPLLLDEVQYTPHIFSELKKLIDIYKRKKLFSTDKTAKISVLFRLTGSNQILLDKHVKESLVGRASYYYLNTLSVNELRMARPELEIGTIIFNGGWPELYINENISVVQYLNDYIRHYIEKDIVLSAGITKQNEFNTVLGLLAARTATFINHSTLATDSGVRSVTIRDWIAVLERNQLVYLLQPYSSNLNKRLIKSPKLYFLDTGLTVRLQGWTDRLPVLHSPQAGGLFETLVLAEIIKFINNFGKQWKVFTWRTKEGEEIDFLIENERGNILALDAKLAIHSAKPMNLPAAFNKLFPQVKQIVLVTLGERPLQLTPSCLQLPITQLVKFLAEF